MFRAGFVGRQLVGGGGAITLLPIPTVDLNLLGPNLPSSMAFSRTSTGTYFDASGVLQTAAANVPRFDADPVTHAARGLLMEDQRINLALQSQFGGAVWSTGSTVLTANSVTSPDGGVTGATLREDNTTGLHFLLQTLTKAASSLTYAVSFFAKAGAGSRNVMCLIDDGGPNGVQWFINPSTGAVVSQTAAIGVGFSGISVTAAAVGNGWWRYQFSVTTNTATTLRLVVMLASGVTNSYTGDNVSSALLYGYQCEIGGFASSYIPTTAASGTRTVDSCSMSVVGVFNAPASTLAAEYMVSYSTLIAGNAMVSAELDDGTTTNAYTLRNAGAGSNINAIVFSANAQTGTQIYPVGFTPGVVIKHAAAFDGSGLALNACANGGVVSPATFTAAPIGVSRLTAGIGRTGDLNGWVRRVRYWPSLLTSLQLQQATT